MRRLSLTIRHEFNYAVADIVVDCGPHAVADLAGLSEHLDRCHGDDLHKAADRAREPGPGHKRHEYGQLTALALAISRDASEYLALGMHRVRSVRVAYKPQPLAAGGWDGAIAAEYTTTTARDEYLNTRGKP